MKSCDTLIVGAGPAGALAATILTQAGWRVVLMDKAKFPRPKVCGDSFNPRCVEILARHGLAKGFEALPHANIRGVTLARDETVVWRKDSEAKAHHRAVDRSVFDHWLMEEARKRGAEVWEETTVQNVGSDGVVQTSRGEVRAKWVLGADGRNSLVARMAGLMGPSPRGTRVGWQTNVPASVVPDDGVHLRVFPEGYDGLTKINATQADWCMVLESATGMTGPAVARRYFPQLGELNWRTIAPIDRAPAELGRGHVWLVGDAARVVEPLTGEGIYFALASAELAAQALLQVVPTQALRHYRRAHTTLYRRHARVNGWASWWLRKPSRARWALRFSPRLPGLLRYLVNRVQACSALDHPTGLASTWKTISP